MAEIKISLTAARVNAKLTQKDLASKLHVSRQTINSWESGKVSPRYPELLALCKICEIPIENIFLG